MFRKLALRAAKLARKCTREKSKRDLSRVALGRFWLLASSSVVDGVFVGFFVDGFAVAEPGE
jgi:hypothetical protein